MTVDCPDHGATGLRVGDTVPVRAHTGILRGEGVAHRGVSKLLRFWLPAVGAVLLAASQGYRLRVPTRREPDVRVALSPVRATRRSDVRPTGAAGFDDDVLSLALRASAARGWSDDGLVEPEAVREPSLWRTTRDAGRWWLLVVPLFLGFLQPDGDGPCWGDVVIPALIGLVLVAQVVRVVLAYRAERAQRRLPWTGAARVVGAPTDDDVVGLALVVEGGRATLVVPVAGRPPRLADLEVRGTPRPGERVDLRRDGQLWPAVGPADDLADEQVRAELRRMLLDIANERYDDEEPDEAPDEEQPGWGAHHPR